MAHIGPVTHHNLHPLYQSMFVVGTKFVADVWLLRETSVAAMSVL